MKDSHAQFQPAWKTDFPIHQKDEHQTSRREFAKFLGGAALASAGLAAVRPWLSDQPQNSAPRPVAGVEEIPVGGYKLFRYPTENDPCILIRLGPEKFVAHSQSCTHLMCPVHFHAERKQLVCPCHEGFFSADDGRVLAGPPRRPLKRYFVEIRERELWVTLPPSASVSPGS